MSLVSSYVESQSGKWYQDPMVRHEHYFICWDDDDPIELVVKVDAPITAVDILLDLKQNGWHLTIIGRGSTAGRFFQGIDQPSHQARSYFLQQHAGAPPDALLVEGRVVDRDDIVQGVLYEAGKQ